MNFEVLETSFNVLTTGFRALESSFKADFGGSQRVLSRVVAGHGRRDPSQCV
jgi:hypothetical protein